MPTGSCFQLVILRRALALARKPSRALAGHFSTLAAEPCWSTNWSVHSDSARELVSDVFRRQAANPKLSRAESLRQSMVALMESSEAKDEAGKTVFTYAHPIFWAPYSIMGDGG